MIKIFIDLDGTICGTSEWISLWFNSRALFKRSLLIPGFPPNRSWKVLTSRPRIDKFIINRTLRKYNLFPEEVILSPTWFYRFKNLEAVANWKSSVLSKEADNIFVDKVIYVDNDPKILSKIIKHNDVILCRTHILNKTLRELEED